MRFLIAAVFLASGLIAQSGYHITQRIPIGGEGGWDYLAVDPDGRRVYVSHGTEVVVLNADTGEIVGRITGLKGVHGIAIATPFGRGYISNGQSNTVTAFDLKSLKKLGDDIPTGKNPDAIIFDAATGRVFAFNGRSSDATAIDAQLGASVGSVSVEGKPEFAVADNENAVYVNIEDKNLISRIDARKLLVEQNFSLAPCESPAGLSMDRSTRRLFAGCHNKMMAVLSADTGKLVTTLPICDGIDATKFDPGTGLIFNSCRDGSITVYHENTPSDFTLVDTVKTQAGSRTMAVDTKTHKLFVPAAEFEPAPAAGPGQNPRPKMVAGSFSVLVLEK